MKTMITVAALAATFCLQGTAFGAAQSKPQQKCINTLNKGMAKVAGAQNKAWGKCILTRAKDGTTDAPICANGNAKVTKAETKTCDGETKACGTVPEFGYTSCNTVNSNSTYQAGELAQDLFSVTFDIDNGIALCSGDKPACKCQAKVYKAALKVYKTRMKVFNKCKKLGLKNKTTPFDDVGDLTTCVLNDLKGKIGKAETKLGSAITKKCGTVANPFPGPSCNGDTGATLATCIAERVKCHTCLTQDIGDDLTVDCDDFDNDSDDLSCVDDF